MKRRAPAMSASRRSRSTAPGKRTKAAQARTSSRARSSARRSASVSSKTQPRSKAAASRAKARSRSGTRRNAKAKASRAGGGKRSKAKLTTDHDEIRQWAEERNAIPSTVAKTARGKQNAGILRLDFPGYSGKESLKKISWDKWFQVFEERKLALLHQDKTATGKQSRFSKLVCR